MTKKKEKAVSPKNAKPRLDPFLAAEILTTSEAADYLKCHIQTIKNLYYKGLLAGRKVGHALIFHQDELESFYKSEQKRP